MASLTEAQQVAEVLLPAIGRVTRRIRQKPVEDTLTLPERSALARLERAESATSAEIAREEQISAQSMGATFAQLERRALVGRSRDERDGRRVVLSVTAAGRKLLADKRTIRQAQLADAIVAEFTDDEAELLRAAAPLLERLALAL